MRSFLRAIGVVMLAAQMAVAQMGPPTCPVMPGASAGSPRATARPSVASANATAEGDAADPTVIVSAEPMENFGVARYRIQAYAECVGDGGCYWSDLAAQTKRAEAALDLVIAKQKPGDKLAVVLDIDETSLTNYCELKVMDYGYIPNMSKEWEVSPQASMPIEGTVRLFNKARAAGIEVFFITGRPGEQTEATARNLQTAGYKGWKGLALRVGEEKNMSTVVFKSGERKKIVDAGYRIVLSMGDQWSDLNGDPKAEVSVKLPNPFYYLP